MRQKSKQIFLITTGIVFTLSAIFFTLVIFVHFNQIKHLENNIDFYGLTLVNLYALDLARHHLAMSTFFSLFFLLLSVFSFLGLILLKKRIESERGG